MSPTQEFANKNLTIKVKREPGCRATLDVTVSPEASEAAYQKALKVVNKEVSLPGFRKGKAPAHIVLQKYAKYIDQEWHELLVQTTFREALDLTKVYPLNDRSVERPQLKKSSREEGSHIIFGMEVMPEIPQVDPQQLTLRKPKRKDVTKQDVEKGILGLRLNKSSWHEIADRPIQMGDYVNLDIDNLDNPNEPICKDTRLHVEAGEMGKWMLDLLLGKKAGDIVEGTSEKEDDHENMVTFIPTLCRIHVNKIEQPEMPELNDEFATKFGLKTLDELRVKVEEDLNRRADEFVQEQMRVQLDDILFAAYAFDVPSSLFDAEKKNRLQNLRQVKKNVTPEEAKRIEAMEESVDTDVLRAICLYFLKRKIAEDNKIQVSQDEIMQETLWHLYNPDSRFLHPSMSADEIRSKVYAHIVERKTADFLVDHANQVLT